MYISGDGMRFFSVPPQGHEQYSVLRPFLKRSLTDGIIYIDTNCYGPIYKVKEIENFQNEKGNNFTLLIILQNSTNLLL